MPLELNYLRRTLTFVIELHYPGFTSEILLMGLDLRGFSMWGYPVGVDVLSPPPGRLHTVFPSCF